MAPRRATFDFFAAQAAARRRTALLVAGFAAAVALVVALVYLAALVPWGLRTGQAHLWNPLLFAWVAASVLAVTAVGTAWQAAALGADGGDVVARRLGGEPLVAQPADDAERRFRDVLEEMAIAAGLPVPRAYVLPREPGVNAFAAGSSPSRAVVAVTRGALDALTRDELQGVVAHELSHVLNLDVRLDARLMAATGGLGAVAELGGMLLRAAHLGRRSHVGGVVALFGLIVAVAGAIGHFCAELLRFAVVREREYLADAAAAQFTRHPGGLAGALRKAERLGSLLAAPAARQVNHFLFANGAAGVLDTWFATHPPIAERVRRLEPLPARATPLRLVEAAPARAAAAAAPAGAPGPAHLAAAGALLASLPEALTRAAREPFGARALACGLLLAPRGPVRERQLARLAAADAAAAREVTALAPLLDAEGGDARVALFDLLSPALDALSPAQARTLRADLGDLARAAEHGAVLAWAFHRALTRRLDRRLAGRAASRVRFGAVSQVAPEALVVLSLLAWAGARDAAQAQAALDAATGELGAGSWRILPRERLAGDGPARALAELDQASPPLKERLLAACGAAASRDGVVTAAEAALVRAVASSLGCPLPLAAAPAGPPSAAFGARSA